MISYVKSLVFEGCVTVHQDWHLKRSEIYEGIDIWKQKYDRLRCMLSVMVDHHI